jgi:NIPSNAP
MKKWIAIPISIMLMSLISTITYAQNDIYEISVYKLKSAEQVKATDNYLKDAFLPAMHRLGLKQIGVFKPLSNDTASVKLIYVLVQYISLDVWKKTKTNLESDLVYVRAAKAFADADTSQLPFERIQSTLTEAFPDQPKLIPTELKSNPDAIYELRSYESPTEELHKIKVNMFNAGGEVVLFKRLDFQAVFYSDVLSGSKMPNLIYMVVFANVAAREEHWKAFGSSPEWKKISTDPQYRNNVSVNHIDSILMQRTSYSDL